MISSLLNLRRFKRSVPLSICVKNFRSLQHEYQLFDTSTRPNHAAVHYSMVTCFRRNCQVEVLHIFKFQLQLGLANIDEVSIAIASKACCGNPKLGCQIHGFAVASGFISYTSVSNSLMNMYCKSGLFNSALCIFKFMDYPDIVSYNNVLSGFENGNEALSFACRMISSGVGFDAVTCTTALAHCTDHEEFLFGTQLHSFTLKCGLECEIYVGNALITLYSKLGHIVEAERIFNGMPDKDLISWNAILSGFAQEGRHALEAIRALIDMVREGMKLDHVSFTSALSASGHERNLELGRQIHSLIIKRGYESHVSVCNVLITVYSKCELIKDSMLVFEGMISRNVVSWTTMISISEEDAMSLFNQMRLDGVCPNDVTVVALIHALVTNNLVRDGQIIHGFCIKTSFSSELNVVNSIITMYAKFEFVDDSAKVFQELEYRDMISWNALISGYAQNGLCQEALKTFFLAVVEMQPNHYTFGSVLSAIGAAESISLRHGQRCHSYLIKLGLNTSPIVSGALLDMYAKRGSIFESRRVFSEISEKNQVALTAIISACSRHGDYDSVMGYFREMEEEVIVPDSITFLSVLTACGRKGMVERGRQVFESMSKVWGIEPLPEHYSCMVDMLGRAGRLKEAEEFVNQIPGGPGLSVLQSLLGSCRIHGNVDLGKRVADALMQMEPEESGSYVLMSNLFAEKGQWEKVAKIRKWMRDSGVKKEVGFSWVDAGDVDGSLYLHGFSSDDKSHSRCKDIYRMAECLGSEMKFIKVEAETGLLLTS